MTDSAQHPISADVWARFDFSDGSSYFAAHGTPTLLFVLWRDAAALDSGERCVVTGTA